MKRISRIIAIILSICLFTAASFGNNTTITSQAAERNKTLKILAIGNSFSQDAQRWMYQIAEDAGYEDIIIANLYWGGCSLWQHWDNAQKDYAGYEYQKNTTGEIQYTNLVSIKTAVEDEEWDFITLQQVSGLSGEADTYNSDLTNLVDYVKKHAKNPNMKLGWHMTWAYQSDSNHGDFKRYNNDQMTMYNRIVEAAKTKILTNKDFSFVIPAGTAIQNLRTSFIGDTLTRDGYHMSYNLGRYVVGLTWIYTVCQQMGLPLPTGVTYTPSQSEAPAAYLPAIHEAVGNAINKPLEVTKSSYTQVSDLFNSNNFTQLDWQPYCYGYWNSTDANAYDRITTNADISKNYIASSVRFTRDQIPVGSVIQVASGYAYRPEGWVQLGQKNPNNRPDMVSSPLITVTDEWWGNYNYRGFNLYKSAGSINGTTAAQAKDILKIYIPKISANIGASDVKSGSTYVMRSAMSQNYALMPKNSRPRWVNVVLYDNTESNSQKWVVNQDGDNYNLKNVGTDLYLHYGEGVKDAHVDQNGFDGSDFYKWKLTRINSGSFEGGYMVEAVKKDGDGKPVYLTADNNNRETELYLRSENKNNQASQVWYFVEKENVENAAITPDKVEEVSQAFLDKYYVDTKQSNGSTRKSLGGGFWVGAELLEMMLDGYQTTGDNRYRQAFESSYLDELDNIGNRFPYWTEMTETNWETNPYNDDIMWLTIASLRAYFMFGNGNTEFTNYLSNAKNNFDMVYRRGLKSDGTIIWCQEPDKKEGTTSCINGPATIAACYLAKATGDKSYYEKAKNIHEAQRKEMFIASTGRVKDSPTNEWASTYNQGTWIGACVLLYEYYHDQQYMDDAIKAMDFVIKPYQNDIPDGQEKYGAFSDEYGILKSEDATTGGDLPIFRSILMRYVRMMIVEFGSKADMTPYIEWMQKNARVAYNNQNIHGLIQTPFNKATPNVVVYKDGDNSPEITDVGYKAPGMSGAVGLMLNLPTFDNTVVRDGFERIEAEEFDYVKGVMTEKTSDADGNRQVGGVLNDYYTAYSNVDFGDLGANQVELRVSTASADSYVEVRLDSLDGELLGTVELPHTQDWNVFATASADIKPVSGTHTIYLVYKNDAGSYVCNINWLNFKKVTVEKPQENKNYAFVSKNSGKAMTIEGYSAKNAAKLCQMPMSNYESQVWTLQDAGDGYYYIVNKFSQKVLNVPDSSTEQGTIIEQAEKADVDSQKWKLEATNDGYYYIIPKLAEIQALDVSAASKDDGAYILQWKYSGADNQKWQLITVEDVSENPYIEEPDLPVEQYTVSFDPNDGTSAMSQSVEKGTVIQQPENPTREGYTFEGWYLEDTIYDFSAPVTDNITLKAKWTENNENDVPNKPTEGTTYTITFDSVGGSQADDQSVKAGETAVKPADPSKEGYTFDGWYLGEIKYDFETPVTENLTLVAKWTEVSTKDTKYTVTFNSNGGTTVTNQSVKENGKVARPIDPVKEGYKFMGWYLEETEYDFNAIVTKNLVLNAEWEADDSQNPPVVQEYSVTFDSDGGSVVANQTVKEGEKAKNPEQPTKEGYTFKGWYLGGAEYDFATEVTKNITLQAQWEKKAQDNTGNENSGSENTGNENSGSENTGKDNTGNENTGNDNSGSDNTGKDNTGSDNTGNDNSGSDNTGNDNGGNDNSGSENTGSENTGNDNGGNDNSGSENTGKDNTGNENSGSANTGKDNTGSANTGNENNPGTPSDDEFKVGVTFEKGKLLYEITKSTATGLEVQVVKPLKKTNSSISIPMQVTYKGKKCKVTSIAKNAFKNNTKLTKVTIAKNVITIGEKAFYNCKKLSKVTFKKNNLKSVGKSAFLKTAKNLNIKTGSKSNIKKYEKLFKKKVPSHAKITK